MSSHHGFSRFLIVQGGGGGWGGGMARAHTSVHAVARYYQSWSETRLW